MKGIFINTERANCSIYSSGLMLYNTLVSPTDYQIDYVEIDELDIDQLHGGTISAWTKSLSPVYDFYIFNYHHHTMRERKAVNSIHFSNLPGKTFCIVLEMRQNDPFCFMKPVGFTDLIVMDPTMERPETNIHAFPRPLLDFKPINKIDTVPDTPIIGSFGYATIDKGFDFIVMAAAAEFERAHIRINLSPSTYADPSMGEGFKTQIERACRGHERPGITVEFTRHYFSDSELVDWCAENTINCFFYTRTIPGLAAATDQAIMSGAPLAVNENTTFRHIHRYIKPYGQATLRELILTSQSGLERIKQDWCKETCVKTFKQILMS